MAHHHLRAQPTALCVKFYATRATVCRSETCVWTCWDECCTWTQLFYAAIAAADVHREEVFEPVNLWVRVAACCAQHCSGTRSLHNLQLGPHVYGGEAMRYLVLCDKDRNKQPNIETLTADMISGWWQLRLSIGCVPRCCGEISLLILTSQA